MVSLGNSASERKVTLAMVRNSLFSEEIKRKDFMGTGVEAKAVDHLGITSQEAYPSLEGK